MTDILWTKPVYIMGCDLIAYSDRTDLEKREAKALIERWQSTSVPKGAKWIGWADAGDGGDLLPSRSDINSTSNQPSDEFHI